MKYNLVISWLSHVLMVLIKLYNMELDHILAIVLLCLKLMVLCLLLKVKMDGIGLSMVSRGMIGKLGRNGHLMLISMLQYYHYQNNQEKDSIKH